jgi:hypothetical protein
LNDEKDTIAITHLFTGDDGRSHIEILRLPLEKGKQGIASAIFRVEDIVFKRTPRRDDGRFHPAPQRQLVVTIAGSAEIEAGDGTICRLNPGDILWAEDTSGEGHKNRIVEEPRYIMVQRLSDDFQIGPARRTE